MKKAISSLKDMQFENIHWRNPPSELKTRIPMRNVSEELIQMHELSWFIVSILILNSFYMSLNWLNLHLGRRVVWASGERAETILPGSSNDLETFGDLLLSTDMDCWIDLLIYLLQDWKQQRKSSVCLAQKIFVIWKSPLDRTHIITHWAIFPKYLLSSIQSI